MNDKEPKVGQVWETRDPRDVGRTVEVIAADMHYVTIRTKTAASGRWVKASEGRRSEVRAQQFVKRFRLVSDPEGEEE